MMIIMIAVLFLICYFPSIMCVHYIEYKNLSKILSFMHTLLRCDKNNKHTHTHIHTITGLFQVFNKKNREARKKKKNYDVSATLLLLGRTSERTGRV